MIVNRLTLPAVVLALCMGAPALANEPAQEPGIQPLKGIRAAAESAVRGVIDPALSSVELKVSFIDARLRLPACGGKLDTFATAPRTGQSRVTVRVGCPAPAWTLNVPVEVRRSHSVLVMRRAVARGETIAAGDVISQTRVLPGLASPFVARVEDLGNRLTRRPIPAGTALPADALEAALLIKRGQQVTLVAQTAGFEVRAPGKAMGDASARQRVRVQNLNSLKIVEGLAETENVVRVSP
jgi:flagella basal body P-ring formation protein FlgA